ncbi:MAG: hypothetical protein JW965_06440 [Bacteroidales bacterium]|nr:hypothetical protein [Bacteroidales bacterium]
MNNTLASDLLFIIIVLLIAAILGFLVGYFIRRPKAAPIDVSKEPGEGDLLSFDAKTARAILGKYIAANDLKIIKGIGPVIEAMLKNNNISTWKALSESEPEHISTLLISEGGERFRMHDPETWPQQAKLAFSGKWEELKDTQHEIVHGHVR